MERGNFDQIIRQNFYSESSCYASYRFVRYGITALTISEIQEEFRCVYTSSLIIYGYIWTLLPIFGYIRASRDTLT